MRMFARGSKYFDIINDEEESSMSTDHDEQ